MSNFQIGLLIGIFIGGLVGIIVMCLCQMARDPDEEIVHKRLQMEARRVSSSLN